MGNNKEIRIVLGTMRYKSAPELSYALQIPFVQNSKEIIEFDRNVNLSLAQVFDDERQKSTTFRPTGKFAIIFKNAYTGITNYTPFENNLYYVNAKETAKKQCLSTATNVKWGGFPQYNEFDFIRNDYNVSGYTIPPNNHINFNSKSASTYNWNFYLSYPYQNNTTKDLSYYDSKTNKTILWKSGDGIPFIITNGDDSGNNVVIFRCGTKHGLSVGEYVKLSFSYQNESYFQVFSLGNGTMGSDDYIFSIFNYGFIGNVFSNNKTGTLKRVVDINNPDDTTSEYYVKQLKVMSNVDDYVLVKSGFEQNVFGKKKKYESSGFTPNKISRVSVKEGSQSYTLSFNKDFNLNGLIDNQKRPVSELFFNVIWKGYFGWTFNNGAKLKQGFEFNLPLINGKPDKWWERANIKSDTNFIMKSYNTPVNTEPSQFYYVDSIKKDTIIDGDLCEWNDFEQKERTVSTLYHKFVFNSVLFDTRVSDTEPNINMFGYYYQPHHKLNIRVFSDYIEEGENDNLTIVPDYSYFSTNKNSFIWRDIYTYGFIDQDGNGVDYPFLNGKHYPYRNYVFRLIPEGTNFISDNEVQDPTIDNCE
jgi:hypothetical protein